MLRSWFHVHAAVILSLEISLFHPAASVGSFAPVNPLRDGLAPTLFAFGALGLSPNAPEPNPALSTLEATHCKAVARRMFLPMESRKEKIDQ